MEAQAKGFTCECGTQHDFGMYVMSHWDTVLIHTCAACGAQHSVVRGVAKLKRRGKNRQPKG